MTRLTVSTVGPVKTRKQRVLRSPYIVRPVPSFGALGHIYGVFRGKDDSPLRTFTHYLSAYACARLLNEQHEVWLKSIANVGPKQDASVTHLKPTKRY